MGVAYSVDYLNNASLTFLPEDRKIPCFREELYCNTGLPLEQVKAASVKRKRLESFWSRSAVQAKNFAADNPVPFTDLSIWISQIMAIRKGIAHVLWHYPEHSVLFWRKLCSGRIVLQAFMDGYSHDLRHWHVRKNSDRNSFTELSGYLKVNLVVYCIDVPIEMAHPVPDLSYDPHDSPHPWLSGTLYPAEKNEPIL